MDLSTIADNGVEETVWKIPSDGRSYVRTSPALTEVSKASWKYAFLNTLQTTQIVSVVSRGDMSTDCPWRLVNAPRSVRAVTEDLGNPRFFVTVIPVVNNFLQRLNVRRCIGYLNTPPLQIYLISICRFSPIPPQWYSGWFINSVQISKTGYIENDTVNSWGKRVNSILCPSARAVNGK